MGRIIFIIVMALCIGCKPIEIEVNMQRQYTHYRIADSSEELDKMEWKEYNEEVILTGGKFIQLKYTTTEPLPEGD